MRHTPKALIYLFCLLTLAVVLLWLQSPATATPEYSYKTDKPCSYCHENPNGGDTLTAEGEKFQNADYVLTETPLSRWKTYVRLIVGLIHILAAVIWFGTIFYIHLFIKPSSFTTGLPLRERILGWICIITVGATGVILTTLKISSVEKLWTTTFGIVWMVKVSLFILMVVVAAVATTAINRKMRERAKMAQSSLSTADGKQGRPAYIVYEGNLYDVTHSKLWANGLHMGRHMAGNDLTEALKEAPHGEEVLQRVKMLGKFSETHKKPATGAVRVFVFLAYFVLFLMLGVLFCVAYWRWGPSLL